MSAARPAVADFHLTAEALTLEGVVAVGYGTQRKVNLTGSVEMPTAEEIEGRPVTSVSGAPLGVMPG